MIKEAIKAIFPGVYWQNPAINFAYKAIDPVDYIFRAKRGLTYLPPYSIRVRSNGVKKQFGGRHFNQYGNQLGKILLKYASLGNQSRVLEIGCGCGRTCFALSKILDDGNYIGMDIEKKSLESCQKNPLFINKQFRFDHLDIQNTEYNPDGEYKADQYVFPYDKSEFDIVFLVSVFTHMLTDDVMNYITEISRILKPNGICMITSFLMDHGKTTTNLSFPYNTKNHYYYNQKMPEVAVGYLSEFYSTQFASHGMTEIHDILWGNWRNNSDINSTSGFPQDILFFHKTA
jgi:SAM-dependent methyltransferase